MSLFSKQELKTDIVLRKGGKIPSCISCKLYKSGCNSPKMEAQGNGRKKILIVLDTPTDADDANNAYLHGKEGSLIRSVFKPLGINMHEDVVITSAVRCKPIADGEGIVPDNFQIDSCRVFMMQEINKLKPRLIIPMGAYALQSVLGTIWTDSLNNIEKWRGWIIPDQTLKCFVAPTYSASFVQDNKNQIINVLLKQDIAAALKMLNEKFPVFKKPNIMILDKLDALYDIKPNTITAFDYETTGLKPHLEGHKIISASIAISPDDVYAFKMPEKPAKLEPFIWYLRNKYIPKMAQNMKFEESWSYNILGVRVKGWHWDTMLMTHVLDNRREITGLKLQGYLQFGIQNYSIEVEQILKAIDPDNANSKNRIESYIKVPRQLEYLLEYNAMDSIVEYRLAMRQKEFLKHILPF